MVKIGAARLIDLIKDFTTKNINKKDILQIIKNERNYNIAFEILKRYPFFGIGYSNNSFASYNSGFLMVGDREVIAGQIDAHNTYLNILGTTGILGFICAFLYFLKLGMMSKKIFNFTVNEFRIRRRLFKSTLPFTKRK